MTTHALLRARFATDAAALVFLLVLPTAVSAHAGMISSEPGRRAVLSVAPKQIRLCFNENVEAGFSKVLLEDGAGNAVVLPPPASDGAKTSCLIVPLPALANGGYTVKYKVLSVDGHIVEYGYGFRIQAAGAVND